jgi:hypothetical protein
MSMDKVLPENLLRGKSLKGMKISGKSWQKIEANHFDPKACTINILAIIMSDACIKMLSRKITDD